MKAQMINQTGFRWSGECSKESLSKQFLANSLRGRLCFIFHHVCKNSTERRVHSMKKYIYEVIYEAKQNLSRK